MLNFFIIIIILKYFLVTNVCNKMLSILLRLLVFVCISVREKNMVSLL